MPIVINQNIKQKIFWCLWKIEENETELLKLAYEDHSINSDSLFMNYIDKNINIENNVVYEGYNNKLLADMIQIDLVSKFSKIYMLGKEDKVKVELKQNGSN